MVISFDMRISIYSDMARYVHWGLVFQIIPGNRSNVEDKVVALFL